MAGRSIVPRRRSTTHVEALHGELCIYEWTTKTVHALNPAAARVWELCNGKTTVDEMIAAIGGAPDDELIVRHALAQFDRAGLLEPDLRVEAVPLVSRRALLRRIGVAAAIPVVTSIVAPAPLAAQSGSTAQFNFTGAPQFFTVPSGVTSINVDVVGARGSGDPVPPSVGGAGGRVQGTLPVTPLEVLTILVGGVGNTTGAFNGGGATGTGASFYGGGGASDVRRGATLLVVAGGGGGAGILAGGAGGAGGGLVGATGQSGGCGGGGGGGTQSAGGTGGTAGVAGAAGSPGASGQGGAGSTGGFANGGGGGGGYFGGGGGGGCGSPSGTGAGGGGSSYTDPSVTSVVHTQGFAGLARVTLTW